MIKIIGMQSDVVMENFNFSPEEKNEKQSFSLILISILLGNLHLLFCFPKIQVQIIFYNVRPFHKCNSLLSVAHI